MHRLAAALCLACLPMTSHADERVAGWGRACRTDLFTIDVPVGIPVTLPPPWAIPIHAPPHWFEQACDQPIPVIEDVFAGASVLPARHYRVHFACEGQALDVRPEAVCAVIEALDDGLRLQLGADAAQVYLARECDGTAQSARGTPWQLDAVNARALAGEAGHGARVALIDTAARAAWPQVNTHPERPTAFALPTIATDHVSLVAGAILDVAPGAQIDSYLGLRDAQGGPTTDVARALGQVIDHHREAPEPLVVNLSLGWPPEMAVSTLYSAEPQFAVDPDGLRVVGAGPERTCVESPAGEAVRAALDALVAVRGARDTVVLAAAGNRTTTTGAPDWINDRGAWEDAGGRFAPAAWAHRALRLIAVGATRPGWVAAHGFERQRLPDLFAPGRRVPVPLPSGQRVTASGTSVAAAYASGVAAGLADRAPDGWFIVPPLLYDRMLSEARCAPAIWQPDPPRSAAGVAGPSYLWVDAPNTALCEAAVASVPEPEVCAQPGCVDRAFAGVPLGPDLQATVARRDNYSAGFAVPQPTPNGCPEDDCFGALNKGSYDFEAWLDFSQMSPWIDKATALEGLSIAIFDRNAWGKAVLVETIKIDVARQLFGQKTLSGPHHLAGIAFAKPAAQAMISGAGEVHLRFVWRGETSTWQEDAALPVRLD